MTNDQNVNVAAPPDAAAVESKPPVTHTGVAFTLAVVGYFMIALDLTIMSVALSAVGHGLGFAPSSLSWVTTSFTLTYAGFMMFGGRVVDLFGRKRSFLLGIALFTAASLVCAVTPTAGLLIGARAVQGVGAAITTPCVLALILDLFPDEVRRRRAMGLFQAVIGSGAGFGLLLGGILTDALGWRWLFLVNVPVGALILLFSTRFLPRHDGPPARSRRFDVSGVVTITLALVLLIYTLSETADRGWLSVPTVAGIVGAVLLALLFGWNEHRSADPLLPLRIPRNPIVYTANIRAGLVSGAFLAALVFLALEDEQVRGHSPTASGLIILPAAVMILALGRLGPRIVGVIGIHRAAFVAPLVLAAGLLWAGMTPSNTFLGGQLGPELLIAVGATIANLANTLSATGGARPEERGVVSALQYTAQQTGSSAEVAAFIAIAAGYTAHLVATHARVGTAALHAGYQYAFVGAGIASVLAALFAIRRGNFAH